MRLPSTPDSYKVKLIKTGLCIIAFMGLGGCNTLLGSALLDLQIRIQKSYTITSNLVPARSIGYLIGGAASSFIDRYFGINIIMFTTNLAAGIFIAIAPWFESFGAMYAFILSAGFFQGVFDIICNTYVLTIWKDAKSLANYVQTLHGAFGIGALITPLISQPFLLPTEVDASGEESLSGTYVPDDVKVQWAFLSITAFTWLAASGFLVFFFKERSVTTAEAKEILGEDEPPRWKINTSIALLCTVSNTAFGLLVLVGSLVPSFVVKSELQMTKNEGATMVTIFWVILTLYKLFFVIASSRFISEDKLMYFSYFCQAVAICAIVPMAASNRYCNYIGFNLLGIGFAPTFAVALSRAQRFFTLTNGLASFIFINGAIGEAIHPLIASRLLAMAPVNFTYYVGALALLNLISCNVTIYVCERIFRNEKKKSNFSRSASLRSWTR